MGMSGPIDIRIDILRMEIAREIKNHEDQQYCFDMIYAVYRNYLMKFYRKEGGQN